MTFTAETLERTELRGEPDWLRRRRRSALEAYERLPMPSRTDEEWRRTDIAGLDPSQFAKFEHANGAVSEERDLPKGVIVEPLSAAVANHSVDEPILGQHFSHESGTSVLPHTLIVAGKGSRFNYLDEYIADGDDEAAYRSGSAEIIVGEGAEVGYVAIQKWGRQAWHFADQRARLAKDATLKLFNITLGARFSKTRVEASLMGPGATAELKGIYFASGEQFFDFHTLQDHQVGNTTSDLLFKGALQDVARTVYAGLIRIEKGAARSDAYQANRNLVLSAKAKATSIPMLEIDNNDVRCTHGATVGPVDPNHLFYLRSRGIPEMTAKRMIVQGFFGQVLDRIPFEQARTMIENELESRLG